MEGQRVRLTTQSVRECSRSRRHLRARAAEEAQLHLGSVVAVADRLQLELLPFDLEAVHQVAKLECLALRFGGRGGRHAGVAAEAVVLAVITSQPTVRELLSSCESHLLASLVELQPRAEEAQLERFELAHERRFMARRRRQGLPQCDLV